MLDVVENPFEIKVSYVASSESEEEEEEKMQKVEKH